MKTQGKTNGIFKNDSDRNGMKRQFDIITLYWDSHDNQGPAVFNFDTGSFINILDINTEWAPKSKDANEFEGRSRKSGKVQWSATRADLVFGSHSELRALSEVYASADADKKFVADFAAAWSKVMELDRFDI